MPKARAIAQSILQRYKPSPVGHQRRQLATLVLMICGLVGSRHVHLPKVVEHTPGGRAADDSVVMRFRRFLKHDGVTYQRWMLPVAQAVLASLSTQLLVLVIDGSSVGRGCVALLLSVVYRGERYRWSGWSLQGEKATSLPRCIVRCSHKYDGERNNRRTARAARLFVDNGAHVCLKYLDNCNYFRNR